MIVMFASALAHMLCFGAKLESYRTIGTSMSTLLSAMLGEFDFEAVRQVFILLCQHLLLLHFRPFDTLSSRERWLDLVNVTLTSR
jgi:hypothetical protein